MMKVEELINDVSFRNWANGTVREDCLKWERYLDAHPEIADLLLTAKTMAGGKTFDSKKPGAREIERAWSITSDHIRSYNQERSKRHWLKYAGVAACLAVLITTGFLLAPGKQVTWVTLNTAPGQITEYVWNDGTKVTLNGNSQLRHPESFDLLSVREVILKGEAFFDVTNLGDGTPFKVRTTDAQVLVLGTVFNIKSRGKNSVISLLEGKVEVTHLADLDRITLIPGETAVLYDHGIAVFGSDVQSAASWRNQLWVFDETPFSDVLTNLEESFGIVATISPDVDASKAISGKLSIKNLTSLYRALETMLGVTIIEKERTILIKNRADE